MVEFALILPLFMMLVMGTFSGGLAYNQKLDLVHAAREGARYGATLPEDQLTFTSPATNWATAVQQLVQDRAGGPLHLQGSEICVALVEGGAQPAAVSANHVVNARFGTRCLENDPGGDTGKRIQVAVTRPAEINALFFRSTITLTSQATASFEG
jgi:Flp pilus assembly protein TadG